MTARIERMLAACCQQAGSAWGLPAHVQTLIHEGRVGPGEIRDWRVRAPAVMFAAIDLQDSETCELPSEFGPGLIRQTWRVAAFCVTRGSAAARGAECRRMAELVAAGAARESWAPICRAAISAREIQALDPDSAFSCGMAARLRAENLYSAGVAKDGIALWGVSWSIDIDAPPAPSAGASQDPPALPSELYAAWAPDTHAESDYRLLEGDAS